MTKLDDHSKKSKGGIILYEVVRVIDGKILFLEDHLTRFFESVRKLAPQWEMDAAQIREELKALIDKTLCNTGNIKFQLEYNRDSSKFEYSSYFISHSYPTETQYQMGVSVSTTEAIRTDPQIKIQQDSLRESINNLIDTTGVYEVLLVHPDGYLTEGSRSNLFMILNEIVYTAPIEDILPGITRKYIVESCKRNKINVIETRIPIHELFEMDAIFITGTSPKVLPVSRIADKKFDVNNQILRTIMAEYDKIIDDYIRHS